MKTDNEKGTTTNRNKKLSEGWSTDNLETIVLSSDYGTSNPTNDSSGIPVLRMGNLQDGKISVEDLVYIELKEEELEKLKLVQGDLLVNRTNSYDLVGKVSIFDLKGTYVFASYLVRFKLNHDIVNPYYVSYFMNLGSSQRQLKALSTKAVQQANLNPSVLKKSFRITYPRLLSEQNGIVNTLSTWDKAIELKERLLDEKKKQKKGLMKKLLTGEVRLPGFEGEWKSVKIGSLLKQITREEKWDDEKLYKLVSVRRRSEGIFQRESLYGKQIATKTLVPIKTNDFLISKMQIVHGALSLVTKEFEDCYVSGSYIILNTKDSKKFSIEYFNYLTTLPRMYRIALESSYGVHIEKMTFNLKLYQNEKIIVPIDIEEQNRIVTVLDTFTQEINLISQELEALKLQKKGLMQLLLTGIVRVPC